LPITPTVLGQVASRVRLSRPVAPVPSIDTAEVDQPALTGQLRLGHPPPQPEPAHTRLNLPEWDDTWFEQHVEGKYREDRYNRHAADGSGTMIHLSSRAPSPPPC
jgi:hypothetical protein